MTDEPESIGVRIKQRRREIGLSQKALAERAEVSIPTVSRWETGQAHPRGRMVFRLAEILRTDPGWMIGGRNVDRDMAVQAAIDTIEAKFGKGSVSRRGHPRPRRRSRPATSAECARYAIELARIALATEDDKRPSEIRKVLKKLNEEMERLIVRRWATQEEKELMDL